MTLTLYGIRNCDTMKKARAWLEAAEADLHFHDYKTAGVPETNLHQWVASLGWERLLNRSGTTFRKLPLHEREDLDAGRAIALMLAHPSIIRRPVLSGECHGKPILLVGFHPGQYEAALRSG